MWSDILYETLLLTAEIENKNEEINLWSNQLKAQAYDHMHMS